MHELKNPIWPNARNNNLRLMLNQEEELIELLYGFVVGVS